MVGSTGVSRGGDCMGFMEGCFGVVVFLVGGGGGGGLGYLDDLHLCVKKCDVSSCNHSYLTGILLIILLWYVEVFIHFSF